MDISQLINGFKPTLFNAVVNDYALKNLYYSKYYTSQFNPTLTFASIQADLSAKVVADVVAFDARRTKKGRNIPAKTYGDIPKIETSRDKTESDLVNYQQLVDNLARSNNANVKQALFDWMYNDTIFALDAVNAKVEWMAKQIASTGKYSLTIANNDGGIQTTSAIDFAIPTENKKNAGVDWKLIDTSDPLQDFNDLQKASRAKGFILTKAIMDRDTFDLFASSKKVKEQTAGYVLALAGLTSVPTLDNVNLMLRQKGLPEIEVWDSYVNIESKSGVLTSTTGWEDGQVMFATNMNLGTIRYTTPVESYMDDNSIKSTNDFTLVKTFVEQDPIRVVTKGVAYATPVLENARTKFLLKTKLS